MRDLKIYCRSNLRNNFINIMISTLGSQSFNHTIKFLIFQTEFLKRHWKRYSWSLVAIYSFNLIDWRNEVFRKLFLVSLCYSEWQRKRSPLYLKSKQAIPYFKIKCLVYSKRVASFVSSQYNFRVLTLINFRVQSRIQFYINQYSNSG